MAVRPELTAREREVARLLDQHLTQADVAQRLGISPRTVEDHTAAIRHKMGAETTRQALSRARRRGLGPRSATP